MASPYSCILTYTTLNTALLTLIDGCANNNKFIARPLVYAYMCSRECFALRPRFRVLAEDAFYVSSVCVIWCSRNVAHFDTINTLHSPLYTQKEIMLLAKPTA